MSVMSAKSEKSVARETTTAAEHYDAKASVVSPGVAGERTDMQRFHNEAKRQMLAQFAFKTPRLLDLACGRGGDIHKWRAMSMGYVKGVDVSAASVDEARARAAKSRTVARTELDFEHADVGADEWTDGTQYDAVTCFFALHYFFESEKTAHAFMATVARCLRTGGTFMGIVPSGRAIVERLKHADVVDDGVVRLEALWRGAPTCFGSAYTFAARDTVTDASVVPEYLVFANVLAKVARVHGLAPVVIQGGKAFETLGPLHTLRPPYDGPPGKCSRLYSGFAFRKV